MASQSLSAVAQFPQEQFVIARLDENGDVIGYFREFHTGRPIFTVLSLATRFSRINAELWAESLRRCGCGVVVKPLVETLHIKLLGPDRWEHQ